jgi:hypothetical protein
MRGVSRGTHQALLARESRAGAAVSAMHCVRAARHGGHGIDGTVCMTRHGVVAVGGGRPLYEKAYDVCKFPGDHGLVCQAVIEQAFRNVGPHNVCVSCGSPLVALQAALGSQALLPPPHVGMVRARVFVVFGVSTHGHFQMQARGYT